MKLRNLVVGLIAISLVAGLASCGPDYSALDKKVEDIAKTIDTKFVETKDAVTKVGDFVQNLFDNMDQYDLSTEGMDVEDGGIYKSLDGIQYYDTDESKGTTFWASGMEPVEEWSKQRAKLYEQAEKIMTETQGGSDVMLALWWISWDCVVKLAPRWDLISTLPAKLDVRKNEWFYMGAPENNPEGVTKWTSEPFAHMVGFGWILTCAHPIMYTGPNAAANGHEAGVSADILINNIVKMFLKEEAENLLLISDDALLIGASDAAKEALEVTILEDVDYIAQFQENPLAAEEYKLTHASQGEGMNKIAAEVLAGKSGFEVTIDGKAYHVVAKELPDPAFYLIGLQAK